MSTQPSIKDMFSRVQNGDSATANGDGAGSSSSTASAPKPSSKAMTVERMYQKKTQLEHILLRPDTYIGSVEKTTEKMWVYDNDTDRMTLREITYVPGLYKIFDEILVNAADNKQRDPKMDTIEIVIDAEKNVISIKNNGRGIPVVMHKEEKMYVPTMIFGHLLTSSNFNDEEEKVTGGRNGYGAKLCNVFSTAFTIETASSEYKKTFKQSWANNMSKASEPKVKEFSGKDYTKVTFSPDLKKFKMDSLDKDTVDLLSRRAYDVAGAAWGVKVMLNGKRIPVKGFKDMCERYIQGMVDPSGNPVKIVYEKVSERWEVACCVSDGSFQQISFVNSIATTKGGRHVEYIAEQVTKAVVEVVKKKNKGGCRILPFHVKNHLFLFVNCLIVNPTFDSQTKENMTLQVKSFGSTCKLNEKFIQSVMKNGVTDAVMAFAKYKEQTQLAATSKSRKQSTLKGVPKLEDANWAGTKDSMKCSLILTEGDSAKALAVSGLSVIGRDCFGVFPLRGKLLNVREAAHKQILENAEINNLIKILGLQYKKKYSTPADMATLRYGKIMIMTDQDQDGSHIKGLVINFIHHNWPSLLQMGFIEEFITPIVKARLHSREFCFYSIPEFDEWKSQTSNWMKYTIKYYKGLGTSTSAEAKEYFTNMIRHRIQFEYSGQSDDNAIVMAFAKKAADQRKEWLTTQLEERKRRRELGLPDVYLYEKDTVAVTYTDFVNKELVLFSNADNERSIPSVVDGLKPGQRKVLFTCFKRKDRREVKVAQLAGSVAELSAYHHGEQSLMGTIVNLAQDFVGSNNINLLLPIGQFGTRATGGKDAASARYIFTKLSPLARHLFNADDDKILTYLKDDNQSIEPEYYVPILPMVLVNGSSGIGTGWMTSIPNFNPRDIVENLQRMIEGEEPRPMHPWYRNYRGVIQPIDPQHYWNAGEVAELGEGKLEITELPLKKWTQDYRESVLDPMLGGSEKTPAVLNEILSYHTDTTVRFVIEMPRDKYSEAVNKGLHKYFKLTTTIPLTNLVLFDQNGCMKRYENVDEILREFYDLRVTYYDKRKKFLVGMLQAEAGKLSNQARFICEKCDGDLVVENKKRKAMVQELAARGYDSDPVAAWRRVYDKDAVEREITAEVASDDEGEGGEDSQTPVARASSDMDFDYLLEMKISSLTLEKKEKLLNERDQKQQDLKKLQQTTPKDMWRRDLKEFLLAYDKLEKDDRDKELQSMQKAAAGANKDKEKGRGKKVARLSAREFMPSERALRIEPKMEADVIKKYETKAAGEKKPRGRKPKSDKDDDDGMGDEFEDVKPLAERLGASPSDYPKPGETKPAKKAAVKRKALATTGSSGGASPAKRGRKPADGSGAKKKPKKRFSWESDESDGESGSASDVSFDAPVEKVERAPRRAAATKPVRYSQSDDDGSASDEEMVFHDNEGAKESHSAPVQEPITLKSDSEEEEIVKPVAKKPTALDDNRDSDDEFDNLFGDTRPLSERLADPKPTSSAGSTKEKETKPKAPPKKRGPVSKPVAKRSYDSENEDDDGDFKMKDDEDDDFSPVKAKPAKKPAAAAKKPAQPRKPRAPKASPAKKRAPAKKKAAKGSDSDSDVIISDGDDDDVSDFRASAAATAARDRPGRSRAPVSYNLGGDESDGSD